MIDKKFIQIERNNIYVDTQLKKFWKTKLYDIIFCLETNKEFTVK